MMTRDETKDFIATVIDDTLETINFELSMETDYSFEEIEELIEEVWNDKARHK
jgi:hypothetical protein